MDAEKKPQDLCPGGIVQGGLAAFRRNGKRLLRIARHEPLIFAIGFVILLCGGYLVVLMEWFLIEYLNWPGSILFNLFIFGIVLCMLCEVETVRKPAPAKPKKGKTPRRNYNMGEPAYYDD